MPALVPMWRQLQELIERDILKMADPGLLVPTTRRSTTFDDAIDAQRRSNRMWNAVLDRFAPPSVTQKAYRIPSWARREPERRPVLQTGDCSLTPLTEAEATEESRQSPSLGLCIWQCQMCFSEDGEAFWHVSPIKYGTYSVIVERKLLADDIKIEDQKGTSDDHTE